MFKKVGYSDIPEIVLIESESGGAWNENHFVDSIIAGYPFFTLSSMGQIIGYYVFSFFKDESHLLNLAVKQDHQGQGFGKMLIEHFLQEVKKIGVKNVYLEVRCSNQKAIKLYEKYNFKRIGTRKNYYRKDKKNPKEDGLIYNLAT